MKTLLFLSLICCMSTIIQPLWANKPDTISTSEGNLIIHFVGHGSLFFELNNKVIHIDPYSHLADYSKLPKADLILITHGHPDHLDSVAISWVKKDNTTLIYTQACSKVFSFKGESIVMENNNQKDILGILIEAVPAYGILSKKPDGQLFHPKGIGNGYILTMGGKRIYIAGDTENIEEMKTFGTIDIAFLPMNQPYTMTPEQMSDAALMVHPKILYPYHYGNSDVSKLVSLLKEHAEIEIRLKDMK